MAKNATTVAQKWAQNLTNSTAAMKAGVQAVTTAPGQLAANAQQQYAMGVQQAVASGKYAKNVAAVSLSDWQNAMNNKGIPRIASGAQAGQGKMQNFMNQFLPHAQAVAQSLPPRGTIDQNIQRMVAQVQGNAKFQYQK